MNNSNSRSLRNIDYRDPTLLMGSTFIISVFALTFSIIRDRNEGKSESTPASIFFLGAWYAATVLAVGHELYRYINNSKHSIINKSIRAISAIALLGYMTSATAGIIQSDLTDNKSASSKAFLAFGIIYCISFATTIMVFLANRNATRPDSENASATQGLLENRASIPAAETSFSRSTTPSTVDSVTLPPTPMFAARQATAPQGAPDLELGR